MEEKTTAVNCWICGRPIPLEECKTDDYGHVVHEACYSERSVKKQGAA